MYSSISFSWFHSERGSLVETGSLTELGSLIRAFHDVTKFSTIILRKIRNTIDGRIINNTIFVGKGIQDNESKLRMETRTMNIGTIMAQKTP